MKIFKIKPSKFIAVLSLVCFWGCKENKTDQAGRSALDSGRIKVAIVLYPEAELLDFAGPSEVFSSSKYFQVYTVAAAKGKLVTNKSTLSINPDFTLSNAPTPDIVVIPGGPMQAVERAGADKELLKWISKVNTKAKIMMSVCTGAGILSAAGLLDGKSATSHSGAIDTLQTLNKKARFISDVRFVEDGKILSTAGVSAGIDGALHVVDKLKGRKEALFVAAVMEYDKWKPEDGKIMSAHNIKEMPHSHMMGHKTDQMSHATDKTQVTDVVCGMTISAENSKYQSTFEGKNYHFCSATCKKLFDNNAALYASKN